MRIWAQEDETVSWIPELYALVYGDGSLYGASDDPEAVDLDSSFWGDIAREEDAAVYLMENVPMTEAGKFLDHGTSDQVFSDGYEAWDAAKPYVTDLLDASDLIMENWPERPIPGIH